MSINEIVILISIGIGAGMLSGMVGIGGGILMVPILVYLMSLNQLEAQGTSLVAMLPPVGILAVFNYYKAGAVNWKYACIISLTFVIGGYLGSKLSINFISESMLKKIFGLVMLVGAIKMIFFAK